MKAYWIGSTKVLDGVKTQAGTKSHFIGKGIGILELNNINELKNRLYKAISSYRVLLNEPMSKHTTFKIGGPADIMVLPVSKQEIADVLSIVNETNMPLTVLGNGSNVLVLDGGIRGIVIKLGQNFADIAHEGSMLTAGAGALLSDVSKYAAKHSLGSLEFAIGIPGSIGGAAYMNAGAYDNEIGSVVETVTAVCSNGEICTFSNSDIDFGYRHSVFHENNCIICEIKLRLETEEKALIASRMEDLTMKRNGKQPLEMPSAGSTFKRPKGYFAGTLIEQAGLKGLKLGGAQVSEKHAGFIINAGGATAKDVMALIKKVQQTVAGKFGVDLQPEVRVLGEER